MIFEGSRPRIIWENIVSGAFPSFFAKVEKQNQKTPNEHHKSSTNHQKTHEKSIKKHVQIRCTKKYEKMMTK